MSVVTLLDNFYFLSKIAPADFYTPIIALSRTFKTRPIRRWQEYFMLHWFVASHFVPLHSVSPMPLCQNSHFGLVRARQLKAIHITPHSSQNCNLPKQKTSLNHPSGISFQASHIMVFPCCFRDLIGQFLLLDLFQGQLVVGSEKCTFCAF